jgi:hypothetical protein
MGLNGFVYDVKRVEQPLCPSPSRSQSTVGASWEEHQAPDCGPLEEGPRILAKVAAKLQPPP